MKRLAVFAVTLMAFVLGAPVQAAESLTWTDLSARLSVRKDRPVWAVAYASPYWFFTDGQDLTKTGRFGRTDGTWTKDLTAEVRKAGIKRIDDIVSDGSDMLLLQGVTANTSGLSAFLYRQNGTVLNATPILRNNMLSNDTLASVTGKDGTWMFVTSKGRILEWTVATMSMTEVLPPTSFYQTGTGFVAYSFRHSSPRDSFIGFTTPVVMPIGSGWQLMGRSSTGSFQRFALKNGVFTDLTSSSASLGSIVQLQTVASDGNKILVVGQNNSGKLVGTEITSNGETDISSRLSNIQWNRVQIESSGNTWIVLEQGKNLYRLGANGIEHIGRVRDYFTQMASNLKGKIVFGGALSTLQKSEPTNPLTAKLVVASDLNITTIAPVPTTTPTPVPAIQPPSKSSAWTWTAPTVTSLAQDGWTTYNLGAWNANGIRSVELYQNDTLIKSCAGSAATVNCGTDISLKNAAIGSTLNLKGKVTDTNGEILWTEVTKINVIVGTSIVNIDQSADISVTNEFVTQATVLNRHSSLILRITANAKAGLNRVVIWTNGSQRSACAFSNIIGVQSCDFQVNGWDYPYGQVLTITTQAIDAQGRETWAGVRTIRITDDTSSVAPNNGMTWTTVNGNTFTVGANDPDGVSRIEAYVNDSVRQTCVFPQGYGLRECSATLTTQDFSSGSAKVKGKIIDTFGTETWTEIKTIASGAINTASVPIFTDVQNLLALSSTADAGYNLTDLITFTAAANRILGVSRIELLIDQNIIKTCSALTQNGAWQNAPVRGIARFVTNEATKHVLPLGTILRTNDGREFLTLEEATLAANSATLVRVISNGSGQHYNLAFGSFFSVPSLDNNAALQVTAQAVDGFTGGIEQIAANNAQCEVTAKPIQANSFSYGVTMFDAKGKIVWSKTRMVEKK